MKTKTQRRKRQTSQKRRGERAARKHQQRLRSRNGKIYEQNCRYRKLILRAQKQAREQTQRQFLQTLLEIAKTKNV